MYSVAKIIPPSQTEEFVIEIWLEGFGLRYFFEDY